MNADKFLENFFERDNSTGFFPFLWNYNNKGMDKRDIDFMWNVSSKMQKKWKSWFVHVRWMRSRKIDMNQCVLHKKINKCFFEKCKRNQILKPQISIAKQDCFSKACICYKRTRRIHTEIESFKERVRFTCLALIAVSSFLLK